jgi:hypothetical protein
MPDYANSRHTVRHDLEAAHQRAWERLGQPGTWLTAAQRGAVAAAARQARSCGLCRDRKAALSPFAIDGRHDGDSALPPVWIDVIHRIVSDPGRLTRAWYDRTVGPQSEGESEGESEGGLEGGIDDGAYVEVVSIVAHVTAVDTFARGLGLPPWPLPEPAPGAPTRYRPAAARRHAAWAPQISLEECGAAEADFVKGAPANIRLALTLVPDEARSFFDLVAHQYIPGPAMNDFDREYRAISHAQIELLAGRVSAINQCTY